MEAAHRSAASSGHHSGSMQAKVVPDRVRNTGWITAPHTKIALETKRFRLSSRELDVAQDSRSVEFGELLDVREGFCR